MRITWTKYTAGAFLLAFLALLISGCGDYGGTPKVNQTPPVTKKVSGSVSYLATGMPLPGATVTAYAIDGAGARASTPLPGSGFSISNVDGTYSIDIPVDYAGALMLEATVPAQSLLKPAKSVQLAAGTRTVRSLVPASVVSQAQPRVMISFATEAVVLLLEQNAITGNPATGFTPTGFSSDNILKAYLVLETFFGPNFSQVAPPASELLIGSSSQQVQNLLVSIQAFNIAAWGPSGAPMAQIVIALTTTGLGGFSATIVQAIQSASAVLIGGGLLDPGYLPSPAIIAAITGATGVPVTAPSLTDAVAPTVPGSPAVSAANGKVTLTWSPSTDNTGVAGYNVWRSVSSGTFLLLATVGPTPASYLDAAVAPSTSYSYQVTAFDAGRNTSGFSTVASLTTPAATPVPALSPAVHTLSGKVTSGGLPLAGVMLRLNGAGTGVALTGSDGSYTFVVLNGSYLITPVWPGVAGSPNYLFSPLNLGASVLDADVTGKDFTAVPSGTIASTVTFPDGAISGSVTYPGGAVTGSTSYPGGTVIGGISYPPGTVVISVTFPSGTVIGGVSYPAGTVISAVSFPNGAVVGGVTYPAGSVVTIVSYPGGSVVGGVSYPSGLIVTSLVYPNGTVIGGVSYPAGTVFTIVLYPSGAVVGGVSYPAGTVITTVTFPGGAVIGGVTYPAGTVITKVNYPAGSVVGGVSFPSGTVVVIVGYPNGTVSTTVTYPNGAVVGGVSYPPGAVVVTVTYPSGALSVSVTYPNGAVVGGVSYPAGTVIVTVSYPNGSVSSSVTYPSATVVGGVTYPAGTVVVTVSYPDGIIIGGVGYPAGTLMISVSYPDGTVANYVKFPGGTVDVNLTWN